MMPENSNKIQVRVSLHWSSLVLMDWFVFSCIDGAYVRDIKRQKQTKKMIFNFNCAVCVGNALC